MPLSPPPSAPQRTPRSQTNRADDTRPNNVYLRLQLGRGRDRSRKTRVARIVVWALCEHVLVECRVRCNSMIMHPQGSDRFTRVFAQNPLHELLHATLCVEPNLRLKYDLPMKYRNHLLCSNERHKACRLNTAVERSEVCRVLARKEVVGPRRHRRR